MSLALRLRRILYLSSSLLNQHRIRPLSVLSSLTYPPTLNPRKLDHSFSQTSSFRSSTVSLDRRSFDDGGKISPDEILFEGCDFNHWLITMDFPKDPKPTAEEMVETYVQTAAKVFGSVEEAKKRIYACSTTTFQGFQALMDEETSEKFRGLPGVVFILPDSYIDPVNKEYGGDKYENGVITPRPPPVQYGRQGRYGDRNRNYDRPRNDRPRDSMSMQQGNPPQDGRGYPQEGGRDFGAGGRPAYQRDFSQGQGGNFPPPGPRNFPQEQRGNFSPQGPRNSPQEQRNYAPQGQGQDGNIPSQEQRNYPPQTQGHGGNFPSQEPRNYPLEGQGYGGNFPPLEQRNYPPQAQGHGGNFPPQEQRNYTPQAQGHGGNFPPQEQRNYTPQAQGHGGNFPPQEQRNYTPQAQGHGGNFPPQEQRNYTPQAQGHGGNFPPQEQRSYHPQGQGHGGNFPPQEQKNYSQAYTPQGQVQGGNFPPQGQGDYRSGPAYGETGNTRDGPVEGQWQEKQ